MVGLAVEGLFEPMPSRFQFAHLGCVTGEVVSDESVVREFLGCGNECGECFGERAPGLAPGGVGAVDPSWEEAGMKRDQGAGDGVSGRPIESGGVDLPFSVQDLRVCAPGGRDLVELGESFHGATQLGPPDGCPEAVGFGMRHVHAVNIGRTGAWRQVVRGEESMNSSWRDGVGMRVSALKFQNMSSTPPDVRPTRRVFLKQTGLAAVVALSMPPAILRGQNLNNRLNLAVIGAGGKGWSDMLGAAGYDEKTGQSTENVVAICDVDLERLAKAAEKFPKAQRFQDYRKMLEAVKEIEACTISTPDHHHGPAAIRAIRQKKHVYVQKPLTHNIHEARALLKASREYKVATLMGNQGHSSDDVRKFCELIWAGAIGPVREVHCWTDRPLWAQAVPRPVGDKPVPANLDWDIWLGPAMARPYTDGYHPFGWRGFWDFGTGALGDMGCHIMDPANWALKLGHPTSVEAVSHGANGETGPAWAEITYQFPARGDMPPVKLVWRDGKRKPAPGLLGLAPDAKVPDNGALFIGDKGKITCETYGGNPRFTPDSATKEFPKPPETLPRSIGHYKEWIAACKGAPNTGSNFEYACPFTEIVLLGNLAVLTGTRVEWDGANARARNVDVSHLVKRRYRPGWEV